MALLPIYRFPFYDDPFDPFFFYPIDFFDPWFDLPPLPRPLAPSPSIRRSFRSIKEHRRAVYRTSSTTSSLPPLPSLPPPPPLLSLPPPPPPIVPPQRFRVQLDVTGFKPESVKTKIEGSRLIIEAKEEDRQARGDFHLRELRKSYDLPGYADANELVSHLGPNNMLMVEVPIKSSGSERRIEVVKNDCRSLNRYTGQNDPFFNDTAFADDCELQPRIVEKGYSRKQLEIVVPMRNYRPDEIKVSLKENILVVRGEHQYNDGNRFERSYFYKTTTLPRGTQLDQIQSILTDDGLLKIEAPYVGI